MVSVSSERFTSISSFFSLGNSAFTTTSSPSRKMSTEGAISSISGLFSLGHHGGPKKGKGRRKKSSKRLSNSSMGGAIRSDTVFASPFDSVFAMGHLPREKNAGNGPRFSAPEGGNGLDFQPQIGRAHV